MIHFNKFENIRPAIGEPVLIKDKKDNFIKYYVVKRIADCTRGSILYEEAAGEEYAVWREENLEGWCSLSEIERNEEWN